MSKDMKIKVNSAAARQILTSQKVFDDLMRRGASIRDACELPGYMVDGQPGRNRARVAVFTGDAEAIMDNAKNNTLLKSIDRGR